MRIKALLFILSFLTLSSFAQKKDIQYDDLYFDPKKANQNKKQPIFFCLAFNYDSLMVNNEHEADFVKRNKDERNFDKPGKGDKWEAKWYSDKKEIYETAFFEGVNIKIDPNAAIQNDKEKCVYSIEVFPLRMNDGYGAVAFSFRIITVLIKFKDKWGKVIFSFTSKPVPYEPLREYVPVFDPGDRIANSYHMAGREVAQKINKLLKDWDIK